MEAIINSQLLYPSLGLASLILVLRAILVVSGVPKPVNFHAWDPFRRKANQEFEADASGLISKGLKKVSVWYSAKLSHRPRMGGEVKPS